MSHAPLNSLADSLADLHARYDGPIPGALLDILRAGSAEAERHERVQAAARVFDRLAGAVVESLAHCRKENACASERMAKLERDLAFYRKWGVRTLDTLGIR